MKLAALSTALCLFTGSALADTQPSPRLIEQYLKQAKVQQLIEAEVNAYATQLGANATPEEKNQLLKYLNGTMGWNVIKEQYAELVQKTYTAEELKAAIGFMKSPAGASITKKNQQFTRSISTLIASNTQKFSQSLADQPIQESNSDEKPGSVKSNSQLISQEVTERTGTDGVVYFTGEVENRGNRPARGVQVEINLFSGSQFVDQYSTYISGVIPANGKRYFKVICSCKSSPPAPHDTFKVVLTEGY